MQQVRARELQVNQKLVLTVRRCTEGAIYRIKEIRAQKDGLTFVLDRDRSNGKRYAFFFSDSIVNVPD